MGKFKFTATLIPDLVIIEPTVFTDKRGFFLETYHYQEFKEAGIESHFVQDNHSKSSQGVLRGLHYQLRYPQGKLVRVLSGLIYDVAVDLRKSSPTYMQWLGVELSAENKSMLYLPPNFAHGFLTLSETAEVSYKCTDYYHANDEAGIIWNDPTIGINWPVDRVKEILLSEKDQNHPRYYP